MGGLQQHGELFYKNSMSLTRVHLISKDGQFKCCSISVTVEYSAKGRVFRVRERGREREREREIEKERGRPSPVQQTLFLSIL